MKTIRLQENAPPLSSYDCILCIISIWITVFYSVIIQYKFIEIPSGMLILGLTVLVTFFLAHKNERITIDRMLTRENLWMIWFMVYMLVFGTLISADRNGHVTQWVTSVEYLFLQIVIASIIKDTGTNTFHCLLLVKAIALALVFIREPVFFAANRYSISKDVNPNGLGMAFATGIWAILFYQQKKKTPLIIVFSLIAAFAYCIILTGSRKALIAAGLTVILWTIFCFFPGLKHKGIGYKIFAVILLIVIIGITVREFINIYTGSTLANRMDRILDEASEGKRSNLYREGFELIKSNPVYGIGFQGFKYNYGTYSHSTLVEIPVSGGIVGSLIYFGAYIVSIIRIFALLHRAKRDPNMMKEYIRLKMLLVLWVVMLFYTTCIIHQYMIESFIIFGLIYGETAYIESVVSTGKETTHDIETRSRYIKV